jgi:hypothetical protein
MLRNYCQTGQTNSFKKRKNPTKCYYPVPVLQVHHIDYAASAKLRLNQEKDFLLLAAKVSIIGLKVPRK